MVYFLKNLAQTRLLEEVLHEIISVSGPCEIAIRHNPDYDSDLTDCDESELLDQSANLNDTKSEPAKTHRSIRVKDLNLTLKEGPGLLTRRLHEVIKSIRSSGSGVVNPNNLFTSVCKKFDF